MALAIEVNNSTIELHLPDVAKEKLEIIDSKCGLLIEANHSTANSNECLGFKTNSESISSMESIHSTVESNCFSTFETFESFAYNVEHSSKCDCLAEKRFTSFEEQKLDCNIYSIKYGERRQRLINAVIVILYPCISFCSALKASLQLKN